MINESSNYIEKSDDFTQQRESHITTYSELVKEADGEELSKDVWGVAEYKGELIPLYIDEGLARDMFTNRILGNFSGRGLNLESGVKIVDFGGGDGVLLNIVTRQLTEAGYKGVVGVNIDMNQERLDVMKDKFISTNYIDKQRKIYGVKGNISEVIPVQKNSIDAGYSRFALQYIRKDKQQGAIKEMLSTLKPGAELVIVWPIVSDNEDHATVMDELDANMDSIALDKPLDKVRGNRHLTSIDEVRKMTENLGVLCEVGFVNGLQVPYSAESFANKFKITDKYKLQRLKDFFSNPSFIKMAQSAGYNVTEENGKTYWKFKVGVAVLKLNE